MEIIDNKIYIYTKFGSVFEHAEIPISEIESFGINVFQLHYAKGGFKKWRKQGFILLKDEKGKHIFSSDKISDMRKSLKNQIAKTEKYTQVQDKRSPKGHSLGERKATNWTYTLK